MTVTVVDQIGWEYFLLKNTNRVQVKYDPVAFQGEIFGGITIMLSNSPSNNESVININGKYNNIHFDKDDYIKLLAFIQSVHIPEFDNYSKYLSICIDTNYIELKYELCKKYKHTKNSERESTTQYDVDKDLGVRELKIYNREVKNGEKA